MFDNLDEDLFDDEFECEECGESIDLCECDEEEEDWEDS